MFRPTVVGLITAVLCGYGCSMSPADSTAGYSGVVEGVVKDGSGQPLAGAFVKLKNPERRLTFMVISQAQGATRPASFQPGPTACRESATVFKVSGQLRWR